MSTKIRITSGTSEMDSTIKIFKERATAEGLEIYQIEPLVTMLDKGQMRKAAMAEDFAGYLERLGAIDGEMFNLKSKERGLRIKGQNFFSGMVTK